MEKQTRNFIMTTKNVSYSKALKALKKGARIARAGWNGKGMYLVHFSPVAHNSVMLRIYDVEGGTEYPLLPFILMKTADDCYVPWLASQTDMLEDDWCIFELGFVDLEANDYNYGEEVKSVETFDENKTEENKTEEPEDACGESEPEFEWQSTFSTDIIDALAFAFVKQTKNEIDEDAKKEIKASSKVAMRLVDEIITSLDDAIDYAIDSKENSLKDKIHPKLANTADNSRRAKLYSLIFKDDCQDGEAETSVPDESTEGKRIYSKDLLNDAINNKRIFITGMPLRLSSDPRLDPTSKINEPFIKGFHAKINNSLKEMFDRIEADKIEREERLEATKLYKGKTLLNTFFDDNNDLVGKNRNGAENLRNIYAAGIKAHSLGFKYLQLIDGTCFKLVEEGSSLKLVNTDHKN